jgi:CspA family cold shock protein
LGAAAFLPASATHNQIKEKFNMSTLTGTVKWFNDAKGFGFITPDAGGSDLFVHFQDVVANGFKSLAENQRVSYERGTGPKGEKATNVQSI